MKTPLAALGLLTLLAGETIAQTPVDASDYPARLDFMSAPRIRAPLTTCMQKVVVEGAVPDAEVMLEVNGRLQTQQVEVADDLGRATFDLMNNGQVPFVARPGTTLRAFARLGAASVYSPSETVRDFSDVYPAGPPEPELAIIYTCGKGSAAWGVPPDVRTFLSSEHAGGPRQQRAHSDRAPPRFFWWSPTTAAGDVFDASYEMCGTPVQSPTVTAVDYPGPLPKPELRKVVEGERMVEIWNYAPGVSATIVNQNGDVRWSGVIADGDFVPLSLSSPVQPNEQLEVTIELCPGQLVTSDPAPPTACGAIEPPRIATPMPDQTDISVIDALPGAIVEVFEAGGTILGRGPASAPIRLRRALRRNERIVVVQETRNGCRSRNGHAYVVPSPLPPQDGDAWAASLFLEAIRAAPPQFRPPFFDNRVYDPVRNPYGTRLQLQTQGFSDALAGPVMLGQPINAFALYDANRTG
jgi:hypothetical protein